MAQYEYYAFISYKSEDAEWAEWLQKRIEHYNLPTSLFEEYPEIPHRIRPIFRDKSDLGAGILPHELNSALIASRFLIVICSKNAVKSPWVNNEVQHFIDAGRTEQIIPFIVDGTPYAGNDNECFPEALRILRGTDNELLGINIKELGKDAAAVKVVARLLGIRFDALWGRYLKEEEKEKQRLIEQNNRLRTSKERASINKAFALVESGQNLLATKVALDIIDSDKKEGWEPLPEVEHLLRASTMGRQGELFPLLSFDEKSLFSPNGKHLLLWDRYRFDLIQLDPYVIKASQALSNWNGGPVFDGDSNFLAIADSHVIHIISLGETSQEISIPVEPKSTIEAMKFVTRDDNSFLCVVYSNGVITEYDLLNSEQHTVPVELRQPKITNALICDRYAILYVKSQESDDVSIYKVDIYNGTVEFIVQTEEEYYLHSADCTKLVYSPYKSLFIVKDLINNQEMHYRHSGYPSYVSNSGLIRINNNDGTVDVLGCKGRYIANAPICEFWLSANEKTCAFAIKDIEKNIIVYFNPDLASCANYDGLIDISGHAIEIRRYNETYLETLKIFGQYYVATGGDFGIDIYDANRKCLVRHCDKGDDVVVSSDCRHLVVTKTMSSDPSHLYRYDAFCHPISAVHGYDILTLDSSGAPIYYNLANKGRIEFFTKDGNNHTITLVSPQSDCSLIDVHEESQLAAFRITDKPGLIKVQNGFCFDDSFILVNLKDFRCIDSVTNKVFQQDRCDIRFSHDGKRLLSINSTLKGLIAFAYEIDSKALISIQVPHRPLFYDRTDRYWAIADKTKISILSTDGSLLTEKTVQKQVSSLRFIGEDKVLAYPFIFDIKGDVITRLESALDVFRDVKFDIDTERDIIVACISDIDYKASVFVWQISSCKLLFSMTNVITTGLLSPYISNDFIYWKDMTLPYSSFEELAEEMSARFAGYKLSDDFREEYYLED